MTKKALISISNKDGIVEFAQELKKTRLGHYLNRWNQGCPDNAGVSTIAIDDSYDIFDLKLESVIVEDGFKRRYL